MAAFLATALLRRRSLLRRSGRTGHHGAALLDDVSRIGGAVLVALDAAARIALAVERVDVALLLVRAMLLASSSPSSEHDSGLPARRYTEPLAGAFV